MSEKLILEHNRRNAARMLTTSLRVTTVFGPPTSAFGPGDEQIIGPTITQAKANQLKVQIGDGQNRNDVTYVGNVAEAHTHAARRLLRAHASAQPEAVDRRADGEAFFITNGDPRSLFGFARQVAQEAGYPVKLEEVTVLPAFMAGVIGYIAEWYVFVTSFGQRKSVLSRMTMRYTVIDQYYNIDKARRQLGFTPRIGVDEGIRLSVASLVE